MLPIEVFPAITEYFGNHALPGALVSRSIVPWSSSTSVMSLCRNRELVTWAVQIFAHSPKDLDHILVGTAHNGPEIMKSIWTELVPAKHLPCRVVDCMIKLCASLCDLDSIEFLCSDMGTPYYPGYIDYWNLCAKYIYGANKLGITDMVSGLGRLYELFRSKVGLCGDYGECATTAALVVNNKAAFLFLVRDLHCVPPAASFLPDCENLRTRLADFTESSI
jgi:hypothetical protein